MVTQRDPAPWTQLLYLKESHFSSHFRPLKRSPRKQNTGGTHDAHTYGFLSLLSKFAAHALPNGGNTKSREMYEEFELADKTSAEVSSEYSYDEFDAELHDRTVDRRTRYYVDWYK